MEKKYPIGDMVMPADKVAFIKEAIEKLKASNKSDYESGEFDVFNHKQEGRYSAFEEVLQWLNPATPQGIGWVKGAPKETKPHYAKVPSKLYDHIQYKAIIIPKGFDGHWWAVGDGFAFDLKSEEIIEHLDESLPQPGMDK
jgi:hypothetical protein